jgi:TBC1 domain family protein 5
VVHLLDPEYIIHDAFTLFETVMDALASAYDVVQIDVDGASAGCLEAMTSSIVSKIRYVARDEALFSHVLYMPVPPQLYFAKWVRLMFGREVAGGMMEVMELWDAFFELASATASMDSNMSVSNALMCRGLQPLP